MLFMPGDGVQPCSLFHGFTAWKNFDFGFYVQTPTVIEFRDIVSIDNGVGLFAITYGPASVSHASADKTIDVHNATFVGTSSAFDCDLDVMDMGQNNMVISGTSRSWNTAGSGSTGGRIGMSWGQFYSAHNNAGDKPFAGIMAYNAINGITRVSG